MIIGEHFNSIVYDLSSRRTNKSKNILLVFADSLELDLYGHFFKANPKIIITSFERIDRKGLVGLRYKEYIVLNSIKSIEETIDELKLYIKTIEEAGE